MAQEVQRVLVEGEILVPEGFQSEGIHIYNKTSGLGTTSTEEGYFKLKMAVGDTLFFTAVQYEKLEVVVNKATLESGKLYVEVFEGLNELPEIEIREHDLMGDLSEDSKNIETVEIPAFPPIPPPIGPPTGSTTVKNTVVNEIGGGANHLPLLVKAVKLLLPKRKKKKEPKRELTSHERTSLIGDVGDELGEPFFTNDLGIASKEIRDFLDFSISKDFDASLLEEKKRLDLIQYLFNKSKEYKEQE